MDVTNVLKALFQAFRLNSVVNTGSNAQLVFGLVLMCVIIEFVSRALSIIVPPNKNRQNGARSLILPTKWPNHGLGLGIEAVH